MSLLLLLLLLLLCHVLYQIGGSLYILETLGPMAPLFLAPAEGWEALWAHCYGVLSPILWVLQPHISNLPPSPDPPRPPPQDPLDPPMTTLNPPEPLPLDPHKWYWRLNSYRPKGRTILSEKMVLLDSF